MNPRTALVTGVTGFVGHRLVPALLEAGWSVRVLTRNPDKLDAAWRDRVEVVEGDATEPGDVARAVAGADAAYYLLHSMDGRGDFAARDRALARTFADAAGAAGVGRMVYLSGLHPAGELSPHLGSRYDASRHETCSGVGASPNRR